MIQPASTQTASELEIAFLTDPGRKRKGDANQDNLLVLPYDPRRGLPPLLIVADGMGGYAGGAIASQKVVETIAACYLQARAGTDIPALLDSCLKAAFVAVRSYADAHPDLASMGSTIVMAAVLQEQVVVANIGDSRAYLMRPTADPENERNLPDLPASSKRSHLTLFSTKPAQNKPKGDRAGSVPLTSALPSMQQISYDHSVVADQVRAGLVTELQARSHPKRNRLTQSISPRRTTITPYIASFPFHNGETLVLCTDGLWGVVPEALLQAVSVELAPEEAAGKLVSLANQNGGPDNISVIIAKKSAAP